MYFKGRRAVYHHFCAEWTQRSVSTILCHLPAFSMAAYHTLSLPWQCPCNVQRIQWEAIQLYGHRAVHRHVCFICQILGWHPSPSFSGFERLEGKEPPEVARLAAPCSPRPSISQCGLLLSCNVRLLEGVPTDASVLLSALRG